MDWKDVLTILLPGGGFFGLAGIAVRYGIPQLPQEKRTRIMYWVLGLGFCLTALILALFFLSFESDGGQQGASVKDNDSEFLQVQSCNDVKTGEFTIWLSFNKDKPYYLVHEEKSQLRVVLNEINEDKAVMELWAKNNLITSSNLKINQRFTFDWNHCRYQMALTKISGFDAGLKYLNKTRKTVTYELRRL